MNEPKKMPNLPEDVLQSIFEKAMRNVDKDMIEFVALPDINDDFKLKFSSEGLTLFEYIDKYQHSNFSAWWHNTKFYPLAEEYKAKLKK